MSVVVCFEYAEDELEPGFIASAELVRRAALRLREQIQPPPTMVYVATGGVAEAVVDIFREGGEEA